MKKCLALAVLVSLLSACGDSNKQAQAPSFVASEGQVLVTDSAPKNANYYAASRLLEQASWGPNSASVIEVQKLGTAAWIDRQLSVPASILRAPNYVIDFADENQAARDLAYGWIELRFMDLALGGEDQLRQRMTLALYNFIVANGNPYGAPAADAIQPSPTADRHGRGGRRQDQTELGDTGFGAHVGSPFRWLRRPWRGDSGNASD